MKYVLTAFMFIAALCWTGSAQIPGSSPSNAAPPGETIPTIVECGEGYTSHELYDARLTVMQILRGEGAWKRIQEADPKNPPAPEGSEYLITRIKFEYSARGAPGLCVYQLAPDQFTAYSSDGEGYSPASVVLPKPELRKEMKSGETFEGWVGFAVSKEDAAPLMTYSVDSGGAVQHGENKWFRLR